MWCRRFWNVVLFLFILFYHYDVVYILRSELSLPISLAIRFDSNSTLSNIFMKTLDTFTKWIYIGIYIGFGMIPGVVKTNSVITFRNFVPYFKIHEVIDNNLQFCMNLYLIHCMNKTFSNYQFVRFILHIFILQWAFREGGQI